MAAEGALDIHLHPLVVLSIADHYTREVAQNPNGSRRCVGLLFGQQNGRVVEVVETVEVTFTAVKGEPTIATEAVETDMKLFSEAYADYECLGWYSSGTEITPSDYTLHTQFKKYNERPLFVLLNPANAVSGMRDLPLTVFEEVIHVINDQTTSEFVKAAYTVQADEAERVTVTHCAKVVNQEESGSAVVAHYTTMIKSVQSLRDRVRVLHQFLLDVKSGAINVSANQDQQILREIKGLCLRLPVMNQTQFRSDLIAEYNDALLVTYLSSLTKGTQLMADVQDKFSVVHREDPLERRPVGRTAEDDILAMHQESMAARRPRGRFSNMLGSFGMSMG